MKEDSLEALLSQSQVIQLPGKGKRPDPCAMPMKRMPQH